jgi:hypothetical protein
VVQLGPCRVAAGKALSFAVLLREQARDSGELGNRLGPIGGGVGAPADVREQREREHPVVERSDGLGVLEIGGGGQGLRGGGGGHLA